VYDPLLHRSSFVNAGHNPPLLVRSIDHSILYLEAGGVPVGMLPNAQYSSAAITISPGDVLIGFTDGIVLEALARANQRLAPEAGFRGSAAQADDETLLIAHFSQQAVKASTNAQETRLT
jgi:hypothetical protein